MSNRTAVSPRLDSAKVSRQRGSSEVASPALSLGRGGLPFLGTFLREPLTVGSCWPSSPALAEEMVGGCDLASRDLVVELGPGTGAFTGLILERVKRRSRFFALEISPRNVRVLRRRFPNLQVYEDCAQKLPKYLRPRDPQKADCIISGLAWGNMLPATQNRIFDAVLSSLAPGGVFTTFAYVHASWLPTSKRFRKRLFHHFDRVETTPIVWRNLPPAYIYRCWREE